MSRAKVKKIAVIRKNKDGTVDDVVITGDTFRLEQMSRSSFWLAVYRGSEEVMFDIWWDKKNKRMVATCTVDELGCVDDTA